MSGGQKIDDHSFWAGKGAKGSVFPEGGAKVKTMSSAEGAGGISKYEDTSEDIKAQQEASIRKIKSHASKPNYRN